VKLDGLAHIPGILRLRAAACASVTALRMTELVGIVSGRKSYRTVKMRPRLRTALPQAIHSIC